MSDLFDDKAQTWDANDRIRQLSSAIGASILAHVRLDDQMNVMDFGAGTGLVSAHLVSLVKRIVAVDVSQAMLAQLASKAEFPERIQPLCRDIIEQPLEERFDLIISAMAMHHVRDTDKMLRGFADHLKPGAQIALADLDREDGSFHPEGTEGVFHHGFDRSDFKARLKRQGFEDIRLLTAHTILKDEKAFPVFLALAVKGHGAASQEGSDPSWVGRMVRRDP